MGEYINGYKSLKNASSKNIYTIFIEAAVTSFASNKGIVSYIVPEGLFKTRSYAECVDVMENAGSTTLIVTFSDYVFENAITGSLIFLHQNGICGINPNNYKYKGSGVFEAEEQQKDVIVEKVSKLGIPLSKMAHLFKGMVVKDRDRMLHKEQGMFPNRFILGKNISKWSVDSFYYTDYHRLEIIGGTKRIEKHNISPRIVIRRTGCDLCCAIIETPCLTESTLYSCWPCDDQLNILFLIGLLNSKPLNYYNQSKNITNQQGFPQILMTDLQTLPIPTATLTQQQPIINLVDKILSVKKANSNADTSEWEKQIDTLVYDLYGLNEDEIRIVEGKS